MIANRTIFRCFFSFVEVSILEAIINILSGQYVLLILKIGYLTNTTYGYIKWTQYIKEAKQKQLEAA